MKYIVHLRTEGSVSFEVEADDAMEANRVAAKRLKEGTYDAGWVVQEIEKLDD